MLDERGKLCYTNNGSGQHRILYCSTPPFFRIRNGGLFSAKLHVPVQQYTKGGMRVFEGAGEIIRTLFEDGCSFPDDFSENTGNPQSVVV